MEGIIQLGIELGYLITTYHTLGRILWDMKIILKSIIIRHE